jgi:hypothetical protein
VLNRKATGLIAIFDNNDYPARVVLMRKSGLGWFAFALVAILKRFYSIYQIYKYTMYYVLNYSITSANLLYFLSNNLI